MKSMPCQQHSAFLAIDGGKPLRSRAFSIWPWFAQDEIDAVTAVLRSGKVNYWTGHEDASSKLNLPHSRGASMVSQ